MIEIFDLLYVALFGGPMAQMVSMGIAGTTLAVLGGAAALGGGLSAWGAHDQAEAAKEAEAARLEAAERAAARSAETGQLAAEGIRQYGGMAGEALEAYGAQGLGELEQSRDLATGQILGYGGMAEEALRRGYGGAIDTFGGAVDQARADAMRGMPGYEQATQRAAGLADTFREQSQLGRLMADPGGYLASDPGYQFRLQEGEEAINRAASARGGRMSGRTLEELQRHGQGLASQEFGQAAQRAQTADAATLQALSQSAGLGLQGAGGLASGYRGIGQMGLQGGAGLAGMQQGMGQGMGQHYTGMGQGLGNLYSQYGPMMANYYRGMGGDISNMLTGTGSNMANAMMGGITAGNPLMQQGIAGIGGGVPYVGGMQGAIGQGISNMGGNLGYMMMTNPNMFGGAAPSSAGPGFVNPSISAPMPGAPVINPGAIPTPAPTEIPM